MHTRPDLTVEMVVPLVPLPPPQVFGANTDVGKTVITAGLLRAAALQVRDNLALLSTSLRADSTYESPGEIIRFQVLEKPKGIYCWSRSS